LRVESAERARNEKLRKMKGSGPRIVAAASSRPLQPFHAAAGGARSRGGLKNAPLLKALSEQNNSLGIWHTTD